MDWHAGQERSGRPAPPRSCTAGPSRAWGPCCLPLRPFSPWETPRKSVAASMVPSHTLGEPPSLRNTAPLLPWGPTPSHLRAGILGGVPAGNVLLSCRRCRLLPLLLQPDVPAHKGGEGPAGGSCWQVWSGPSEGAPCQHAVPALQRPPRLCMSRPAASIVCSLLNLGLNVHPRLQGQQADRPACQRRGAGAQAACAPSVEGQRHRAPTPCIAALHSSCRAVLLRPQLPTTPNDRAKARQQGSAGGQAASAAPTWEGISGFVNTRGSGGRVSGGGGSYSGSPGSANRCTYCATPV